MSEAARRKLAAPTLAMLPRISDSLSFLYLDVVRIVQDDTGVCAQVESRRGVERVYLPTAALACVLLGPGTSITQRALTTFARHGTSVVATGAGGVRCYAGILPDSLTTTWLERQVHAWADDSKRLSVAVQMYKRRFEVDVPEGTTLAQLRGMEGQRVKALYKALANKHRTSHFRRSYDPERWDDQDPVNMALSAANVSLYGAVHAAILGLGCSPALGFVHSGTQHAFVYDVADLYKAEITIPLAFSLAASEQPDRQARLQLRDEFRLLRLLPTIVNDIQSLFDDEVTAGARQPVSKESVVSLWDPKTGPLPAGVNYGNSEAWDEEWDEW